MHARVLANMKYYVKIAHGILERFYQALHSYLLFGTGQGSGMSPSVWLTLVICLLLALSAMAPIAMKFVDPWNDISNERNADSYVDDTAVGVSDAIQDEPMSIPEIIGHLQDIAQKWERILYSSGGALKLCKCFWYLVYWEWVDGRPQMMPSISSPVMIALTEGHLPVYMVIERKEAWEAMCTLGIRVAPDGNYRKEAQFLWTKANTFVACLMTLNLNRIDTFIFHWNTYTPSRNDIFHMLDNFITDASQQDTIQGNISNSG